MDRKVNADYLSDKDKGAVISGFFHTACLYHLGGSETVLMYFDRTIDLTDQLRQAISVVIY